MKIPIFYDRAIRNEIVFFVIVTLTRRILCTSSLYTPYQTELRGWERVRWCPYDDGYRLRAPGFLIIFFSYFYCTSSDFDLSSCWVEKSSSGKHWGEKAIGNCWNLLSPSARRILKKTAKRERVSRILSLADSFFRNRCCSRWCPALFGCRPSLTYGDRETFK